MKTRLWKKLTAVFLSLSMLCPAVPALAAEIEIEGGMEAAVEDSTEEAVTEKEIPEPCYRFDFENRVNGNEIPNEGSKSGAAAKIEGSGDGLAVVEDSDLGSKVLNLPGNGLGQGYLTLPDDMFADVSEAGFAFSLWVRLDVDAGHYNRIFSASSMELNSNDGDWGAWNAPEFTVVAGGTDTADTSYNTSVMMSDRTNQMRLAWDRAISRGKWQHVIVSVDPSSYDIYLDGEKILSTDRNGNKARILSALFADQCAEIKSYTHNAIGRSVYTTDNDLRGKIDDFCFYNTALMPEQAQAIYDTYGMETKDDVATLHFDAAKSTGEMLHGSTGFLYGVSEVNIPSADLVEAIRPKVLVQKAADGKQHPSGDGYRLTSYLDACGAENIQIYIQDYYLEWPYENTGIEDYNEKVRTVVTKTLNGKFDEEVAKYSFVLFNEPNWIWYGADIDRFCRDWLTVYTTVKSIHPKAKVVGPNYDRYVSADYKKFFEFCKANDCLPDFVTWHELNKGSLTTFHEHCSDARKHMEEAYKGSGIDPIILINETVDADGIGNPGQLVNWLSIFEEEKVYACLPYWGLANSLNELASDANEPNGAWWIYKWYAQMTGHTLPLRLENIGEPCSHGRLYGLGSVDDENRIAYTLFGGQAGEQRVRMENIRETETFQNAKGAHVKIYRTKYTGHQGFADEIPVVFEGDVAFSGEDLEYGIPSAEEMDAYFAVVTPAHGDSFITFADYQPEKWQKTYEAEDGTMLGAATVYKKEDRGDLARSNRAEVGSLNQEGDGVHFDVAVPRDGTYRLNVYYSNQAPQVNPMTLEYVASGGQNRAIGTIVRHKLAVDGKEVQTLDYESTVKWGYYNYAAVYLELAAGDHSIEVTYTGENQNGKDVNSMQCAVLDKIDLTFEPSDTAKLVIEPEELTGSQNGYHMTDDALAAEGSGMFDFYVNAPKEGYYDLAFAGQGTAKLFRRSVQFASDAKAETPVGLQWKEMMNLNAKETCCIYLAAGMNHLALDGGNLLLEQIVLEENKDAAKSIIAIEAEHASLSGQDIGDGYNYPLGGKAVPKVISHTFASGGKAVEGFRGGKNNALSIKVKTAEAGDYRLSMVYANNEPAPVMKTQAGNDYVHPYNTDLVERYAQISVNGAKPQTVYFINTLCWDTYRTVVIDVTLEEGENTITFTNDNSYKFSELQDDFTPRFDKFRIALAGYPGGKTPEEPLPTPTPTIAPEPEIPDVLADFTFDDEAGGFSSTYGKAQGTYTLTDSYAEAAGKALYLDGSNTNFLKVTNKEGGSLLTGVKEMTVSFDMKSDRTNIPNWPFFAAPSASEQQYLHERYIGLVENTGELTAERYKNKGERVEVNKGTVVKTGWFHIDLVYTENGTTLYVDGEKQSEVTSAYTLEEILKDSSILQIGKANWTAEGEYFKGWIDNYKIVSHAASEKEIEENLAKPVDPPKPTEPPKPTDTPKPPKPTDTPKPPKPTDTPEPTDTPKPPKPTDTPKPTVTPTPPGNGVHKNHVGKTFTAGTLKYKVTRDDNGGREVRVTSLKKNASVVKIPRTVVNTEWKETFRVTSVKAKAFKGKNIRKAVIGANVVKIGPNAFLNCKKLKTAVIGKSVKNIGIRAFYGCTKLSKVTVKSKGLKNVKKNAFKRISAKAVMKVPKGKKKKYKDLLAGKIAKGVKVK